MLRIGYVALTDAAPIIAADAHGWFRAQGADVRLQREIGWATIRDKIIYGELDAAHAPAPMLWSAQLGINCPATDVLTAFVLNLHGNALTLSRTLWDAGVRDDAALRVFARERRARAPLTFGVVSPFSSHHLMLRRWLRGAGMDPDRDVRIAIVPPAQMFRNLAAGTLDGFCVGEPWNTVAIREGAGWCRWFSAAQQPGHVEKVLMVSRHFAESRSSAHSAVLAALTQSATWCDEPQNREPLAAILADKRYLNQPVEVIAPALTGRFQNGTGHTEPAPDFHIFHRHAANAPLASRAELIQRDLCGAGLISAEQATAELPGRLFREDLYRASVAESHDSSHLALL